jgi:glycosyltransferase involved in cell wall biosynthesis
MIITINAVVILLLIYWCLFFIIHLRGLRLFLELPFVYKKLDTEPLVSVIIAAKDEEKTIGPTIASLFKQSYKNLEIIVVNDRSTDRTSKVVEQIQSADAPQVKLINIEDLPAGWLGKNNAMYKGYMHSKGDYLLFTDADIEFAPDTVRSAVSYFSQYQVDHITLMPFFIAKSFWLRGFVHLFAVFLYATKWPWKPNDDKQTKQGIGFGAFNMLTRDAYEKIGTHKELKLRPDDDLQLGMKVKQSGLKQRYMIGADHIKVEWYPSLTEANKGLEKNIFAGINYSLPALFFVIMSILLFYLSPFIGIWFMSGWQQIALALTILFIVGVYLLYSIKVLKDTAYEVVVLPLLILIYLYIFIRSCILILRRGGMYWRGTFYSLEELKQKSQKF